MNKTFTFLSCLLTFFSLTLIAREPYDAKVRVDTEQIHVSAPNLVDLSRSLRTSSIESLAPIYTPTSPVLIDINLRGVLANTSFAANSTTLVVTIPQSGTTTNFTGGTRDESILLFKQYIRDGGNNPRLLKAYAKYSPIDPIAGNPNSLMAFMGSSDYALGKLSPLAGCCCYNAQPIVHQFQVGLNALRGFSKGYDTSFVNLPLRYSYSPDLTAAIILDAPFAYIRNGGASSVFGSLAFGLRLPVTNNWSLSSILRAGSGGSLDLCTSGSFVSAAILSAYNAKIWKSVLTLTNYVGYFSSTNFWLTGINYNYHLQNYIIKNGISLNTCEGLTLCQRPINFGFSFTDTYFTKNKLYIKHYDEIGLSVIANNINPHLDYDCITLQITYQFGEKHYKGYCFNTIYQF